MANNFKPCAIADCKGNSAKKDGGRGWCGKHYQRWKRSGDPLKVKYIRGMTGQPCTIDGCDRPIWAKMMCTMHYDRSVKHGDPLYEVSKTPVQDWIRDHAEYDGEKCLTWPFSSNESGRGCAMSNGRVTSAPRAMCIAAHGEPDCDNMQAAHICGKGHKGCVHPKHLRWATPKENEADKAAHGTLRRGSDISTSVLSERQVRSILSDNYATSGVSLAKHYGVTVSCISNIRTRKSWAWVEI